MVQSPPVEKLAYKSLTLVRNVFRNTDKKGASPVGLSECRRSLTDG